MNARGPRVLRRQWGRDRFLIATFFSSRNEKRSRLKIAPTSKTVPTLAGCVIGSSASAAETVTTATSTGGAFQMVVGLLIVLAILFGGAWLLRRFVSLPSTARSPLKIITGLSLSPRDRLIVIQVGEQQILLGLSPGRIQTLHVLEQPLDPNATPDSSLGNLGQRFGALLQNQMKKPQ